MTMEEQMDLWHPLHLGLMVSLLAILLESRASGPKELLLSHAFLSESLQRTSSHISSTHQAPSSSQDRALPAFSLFL